MSEADEGLELRSGRVVAMVMPTSESEGKQIAENVDELRSCVHELEQIWRCPSKPSATKTKSYRLFARRWIVLRKRQSGKGVSFRELSKI